MLYYGAQTGEMGLRERCDSRRRVILANQSDGLYVHAFLSDA